MSFWREGINIPMWGSRFAFKVNTYQIRQYISLPSIVVANCHCVVFAAAPNVITLIVNIRTYTYNWKGLINESTFPAHLYLVSYYYIFRDHSVNLTVDSQEGVFIDGIRTFRTQTIRTQSLDDSYPTAFLIVKIRRTRYLRAS